MIMVVILGIIVSIVLFNYFEYVKCVVRSEVVIVLLDIVNK